MRDLPGRRPNERVSRLLTKYAENVFGSFVIPPEKAPVSWSKIGQQKFFIAAGSEDSTVAWTMTTASNARPAPR